MVASEGDRRGWLRLRVTVEEVTCAGGCPREVCFMVTMKYDLVFWIKLNLKIKSLIYVVVFKKILQFCGNVVINLSIIK